MITKLRGELEIDHERGVIYFHLTNKRQIKSKGMITPLRICSLPTPIPKLVEGKEMDITHMHGSNWKGMLPVIPQKPYTRGLTPTQQREKLIQSLNELNKQSITVSHEKSNE